MNKRTAVDPQELMALLRIDAATGRLFWLPRAREMFLTARSFSTWNACFAGKEAFTAVSDKGYRHGVIFGRHYRRNRVVFALHHGRWPSGQVDHINGAKDDDRPDNLREATNAQNCRNIGSKGGSSQYCGVYWRKRDKRWFAECVDATGRGRYIGRFTDEVDAARAYDVFAAREHGEFARLNFPVEGHNLGWGS